MSAKPLQSVANEAIELHQGTHRSAIEFNLLIAFVDDGDIGQDGHRIRPPSWAIQAFAELIGCRRLYISDPCRQPLRMAVEVDHALVDCLAVTAGGAVTRPLLVNIKFFRLEPARSGGES